MSQSRLIPLSYYDPQAQVRLSVYADTVILESDGGIQTICAARFGGYPEMVRAMSDAMYAGATVETTISDETQRLQCRAKGYQHQLAHDGV